MQCCKGCVHCEPESLLLVLCWERCQMQQKEERTSWEEALVLHRRFLNKQILGELPESWSLKRTTFQGLARQLGQQKREHHGFHLFLVDRDGLTLNCVTEYGVI